MIIVKTPQPDTEERLVLVPPDAVSRTEGGDALLTIRTASARDATPEDLGRAGWVPERDDTRAGLREALRARERAELDALAELDEQRARAEKAEAFAKEIHWRCESLRVERNAAQDRTEKAERERDEARDCGQDGVCKVPPGCQRHWAERNRELLAERGKARAELARLAPTEGEPTLSATVAEWYARAELRGVDGMAKFAHEKWRAGVAHERARHARTEPRATDQELFDLGERVRLDTPADPAMPDPEEGLRCAAYLAVAARVRKEQCLVAQAVADPLLDSVSVGAVMGGALCVRVVRRHDSLANTLGEPQEVFCGRADVPATLARLLGEVKP